MRLLRMLELGGRVGDRLTVKSGTFSVGGAAAKSYAAFMGTTNCISNDHGLAACVMHAIARGALVQGKCETALRNERREGLAARATRLAIDSFHECPGAIGVLP